MIGDIASGHTWGADVLFLVAAIVFGIASIVSAIRRRSTTVDGERSAIDVVVYSATLAYAGLCILAIAWLVL